MPEQFLIFPPGLSALVSSGVIARVVGATLLNWIYSLSGAYTHCQWWFLPWLEMDPLLPKYTHVNAAKGGLPFSGEQCQRRKCWSRSSVHAVSHAGAFLACQPEHQTVFNPLPLCWNLEQTNLCVHFSKAESCFLTVLL